MQGQAGDSSELLIIWGWWQGLFPTVLDLRGFKIWSYDSQLGSLRAGPCFWGAPSRIPASMLNKAQATRKGRREVLWPTASAGFPAHSPQHLQVCECAVLDVLPSRPTEPWKVMTVTVLKPLSCGVVC